MSSIARQGDGTPPREAVEYIERLFERHPDPRRPGMLCVQRLSDTERRGLWRFLKRFRPRLAQQVKAATQEPTCQQLIAECKAELVFARRDLLG